jgi:hypothetical protein
MKIKPLGMESLSRLYSRSPHCVISNSLVKGSGVSLEPMANRIIKERVDAQPQDVLSFPFSWPLAAAKD